ncbi:MAG: glycosyltransferase family 39 protein [Bryobacterales bacterium]|nr:glycosyltransferase family 39 protein [Bryobacterales bacterium]
MKTVFYALLGALVVVAGSGALGAMLLHALRLRLARAEAFALSFLTGSALFSGLWMALGMSGIAYRGVAYGVSGALLLAAFALGSFRILRGDPPDDRAVQDRRSRLSAPAALGFALLFLPYLAIYLLYALHPEVSADGSYYHNGFLNQYAIAHRIIPFADNFYASLSQAAEIQALPGFLIGKHCVPGLVQLVYLFATTALIVCFGREHGDAKTGWSAGLLFFAIPAVGYVSTQALNDMAVSAAVFGAFYCMYRWWENRENGWLLPAGLLAGMAYATKYSAFLTAISFAAVMAWRWRRHRDLPWRWALAGCLGVAVMVLPYLLRNWIWYGNPLAPFYNSWFPNDNFSSWVELDYRAHQRTYGWLKSYWDVPWDLIAGGRNLQGILGPVVLALPLGLLALRRPVARVLLLAGGVCLLTYPQNVGARFLIPALPFLLLLLAMVAVRWREALGAMLAMQAILCWPTLVAAYTDPYALILAPIPTLAQITRKIPEEETLAYRLNTYYAARWLDRNVEPGERVFGYNVYTEAYSSVHACVAHTSTHCFKLADIFASAIDGGGRPDREWEYRFDRQPLQSLRLLQTGKGRDRWNLREIQFFRGDVMIPLPAGSRLEASRNQEDLPYLFDGNLVTGWSPWEFMAPGQSVTMLFPQAIEIDRIVVRSTTQQDSSVLHPRIPGKGGGWRDLAGQARITASIPTPDLRKEAMAEFYRRGYRYLFLMRQESYVESMEKDATGWNLERAAWGQDWRIFRILPPEPAEGTRISRAASEGDKIVSD